MSTMTWKTSLVQKLNDDSTLRALVGNRIYPAYLASIRNPKFPCVNFYSEGGSRRISYLPFALLGIRFWAYSAETFEEANDIFDRISAILNDEVLTSTDGNFVFSQMAEPVELHEDKELRSVTAAFVTRRI